VGSDPASAADGDPITMGKQNDSSGFTILNSFDSFCTMEINNSAPGNGAPALRVGTDGGPAVYASPGVPASPRAITCGVYGDNTFGVGVFGRAAASTTIANQLAGVWG